MLPELNHIFLRAIDPVPRTDLQERRAGIAQLSDFPPFRSGVSRLQRVRQDPHHGNARCLTKACKLLSSRALSWTAYRGSQQEISSLRAFWMPMSGLIAHDLLL